MKVLPRAPLRLPPRRFDPLVGDTRHAASVDVLSTLRLRRWENSTREPSDEIW